MDWASTRRDLDRITHGEFAERATYRSPAGPVEAERVVAGVLRQGVEATTLTDFVGHEGTDTVYELRKHTDETAPLTVDDFPEQGTLTLDTGAAFVVVYAIQTDTLIFLGLAPVEP